MFKKELKIVILNSDKRREFLYRVDNGDVGIVFFVGYKSNGVWELNLRRTTKVYPTTWMQKYFVKHGWYRDNCTYGVFALLDEFSDDGEKRRSHYKENTTFNNKLLAFVNVIRHFIETEKPRELHIHVPDVGMRDDLKTLVKRLALDIPIKGYRGQFDENCYQIKEIK